MTARARRFPAEFEELLSPRGRRVLAGRDKHASGALQRSPFFSSADLVDARWAKQGASILAKALGELMEPIERQLPDARASIFTAMETLPKVGRMLSSPMGGGTETPAYQRALECGLAQMLLSKSFAAFANQLAGTPLRGPGAMQALCYRPGDYAGPHTDNHPDDPETKNGYVDVHLTFCTPGVAQQSIVYEREGHLAQIASIAESGTITAYRLPVWHYTTPLQVKSKAARRWLVLGTFYDVRE